MLDTSILADEHPLDNETRLQQWLTRLANYKFDLLMEKVEELDDLIGMGELPANWWHRKQGE